MASIPTRTPRDVAPVPAEQWPRERKGDERASVEIPRIGDRRAASGCLWDACEALLSSADPRSVELSLDRLLAVFECDGVALHALGAKGHLEPWCARGEWQSKVGDLRQCMSVPLLRGRERVGALDLRARKGQRWRPEQLALVRTASGALGAALGTRLELERLRHAPGRDAVTGLADERTYHARMLEEVSRSERTGQPLAVVEIGLDHFEGVNRKYGNATGDEVLAECARVLRLGVREGDLLARLSGDRFGVVLADCAIGPARRLAERLRHHVEDHRFARIGRLSCSAGVAASPRDGTEATELVAAVERALGLAKKAGRRRTAASGPAHTH